MAQTHAPESARLAAGPEWRKPTGCNELEIAASMRQGAYTGFSLVQVAVVLAVCALALTVCVALISTSELKAARPVALYGLGSGEEQDTDNSVATTFEVRRPWRS